MNTKKNAAHVVAGRFPRLWAVLRLSDNVIVQTSSTDGWLGEVYSDNDKYVIAEVAPIAAHSVEENSRLKSGIAETMPASEAQTQLGRMRSAFHINMLRSFPEKSHAEISAEIDRACGIAAPDPKESS